MRPRLPAVGLMLLLGWTGPSLARAQTRVVDTGHSTLEVRVFKSGLFSAFAHDHEIEAMHSAKQPPLHRSTPWGEACLCCGTEQFPPEFLNRELNSDSCFGSCSSLLTFLRSWMIPHSVLIGFV